MASGSLHREETDLGTWLVMLAGRVRTQAMAARGMGTVDTTNAQVGRAIADALDDIASALATMPEVLCKTCQLVNVIERVDFNHDE